MLIQGVLTLNFERVQVIGRWKNIYRKRVPEFTSVRDERMKILVNSCIRKMNRIGIRRSRKPCAARLKGSGGMQLASS